MKVYHVTNTQILVTTNATLFSSKILLFDCQDVLYRPFPPCVVRNKVINNLQDIKFELKPILIQFKSHISCPGLRLTFCIKLLDEVWRSALGTRLPTTPCSVFTVSALHYSTYMILCIWPVMIMSLAIVRSGQVLSTLYAASFTRPLPQNNWNQA